MFKIGRVGEIAEGGESMLALGCTRRCQEAGKNDERTAEE
jgi:hypothetical protein